MFGCNHDRQHTLLYILHTPGVHRHHTRLKPAYIILYTTHNISIIFTTYTAIEFYYTQHTVLFTRQKVYGNGDKKKRTRELTLVQFKCVTLKTTILHQ